MAAFISCRSRMIVEEAAVFLQSAIPIWISIASCHTRRAAHGHKRIVVMSNTGQKQFIEGLIGATFSEAFKSLFLFFPPLI
jgi:hypothetical protein